MDEQLSTGNRAGGWLGILAMVGGLTLGAVCAGILGTQILHVKWQIERQRRVRALVAEAGLPREFIPGIQASNRWAIGGSVGVVFGVFWFVWGLVRHRDQLRCGRLLREAHFEDDDAGIRTARRRTQHRSRR